MALWESMVLFENLERKSKCLVFINLAGTYIVID